MGDGGGGSLLAARPGRAGLDNDPDEVIRVARTAEKLDGRRSPERTVNHPGEAGAIESIRTYQWTRGLKPDGLVNPDGPTAQRMTAELFERDGPRRRNLARGGTVPLWGPVGAGGDNDPRDLAATRHALFLAGLPVRGTDAETPLRRFQQMHGLAVDGRMEPFGPTHDMLDRITAPKLATLAGDDPGGPLSYKPRQPEMVGRVLVDRPTTVRTFLREPETLPTEAQHAAAVSLARMSVEDAAIQAQWGALAGGDGDDLLAGGEGEDGLDEAPGRDVFSGVEPPPDPVAIARQRLEQSGVPLTPRQLDAAAREAVSQGMEFANEADLQSYAESIRRTRHDHYRDLEEGLESGRMDIADVEDRLAVLTRDRVTALGNDERRHRIAETTEFLSDQYIAEARAEGIEIDAEAARARVARIVEAATEGDGIDLEMLGDVLWATLDFIPVAGELKSGYEAVDLYGQILDKLENDPNADVTGLYADLSLAIFGAVPFLGKVVKGVKLAERASAAYGASRYAVEQAGKQPKRLLAKLDGMKGGKAGAKDSPTSANQKVTGVASFDGRKKLAELRALDGSARAAPDPVALRLLKQHGPGRFLDQQKALREWAEILNRNIGPGAKISLKEMAKENPILRNLSTDEFNKLQSKLSKITGDVAEVHMRAILERTRLAEFDGGRQTHSLKYDIAGRPGRVGDAVLTKDAEERAFEILGRRISWMTAKQRDENKALFVELKSAGAAHDGVQKETDRLINESRGAVANAVPQKIGNRTLTEGPEINEAALVRLHVNELPKDLYFATIIEGLEEKGFSDDVIAGVLEGVEQMYQLDPAVRSQISVRSAIAASFASAAALSLMTDDNSNEL